MNAKEKKQLILRQLNENITHLDRSGAALHYSYSKCRSIVEKDEYEDSEQESFEALTSRFARSSDILTQKVLKTLFLLIHENPNTFLDAANLSEKIGIVDHADDLINIRELRNQIAHEYVVSDLQALYADVLQFVPHIEKTIENVKNYIGRKIK